jgi:hypothetical protein
MWPGPRDHRAITAAITKRTDGYSFPSVPGSLREGVHDPYAADPAPCLEVLCCEMSRT